jgi:hypothetical protein
MNKYNIKKRHKYLCSPNISQQNQDTCLNKSTIHVLKKKWNNKNRNMQISSKNPVKILNKIRTYTKKTCKNDKCILEELLDKQKYNTIIEMIYKPFSPNTWDLNPNEWLSNYDIKNVLSQYEKIYKCFISIGPSPVNYSHKLSQNKCVWNDLCNFNLKEYIKSGKTKIGVVFNLDKHDQPGSHWVGLFINITTKKIYYFDSTGRREPYEIEKLVETIMKQGNELSPTINFTFERNTTLHQKGSSECGMYTLFFIIEMLLDKLTISKIKNSKISDKKMMKLRNIYFNNK